MFKKDSPETKLRKAVTSLIATHRFFGVLALRMPFSPGQVETIAGNGIDFTFSPDWVADATHDEIKGCIAHIVFACALKHHVRRGGRNEKKWNRASRIATAEMLESENLWLPDGLTGQDLPIEIIYDRLPDDENGGDSQDGESPSGGAAAGSTGGNDQPGSDGAAAGEAKSDAPGEILDAPADQAEKQDQEWDKASKQALNVSKATGSDPGNISGKFAGQHVHRRDWQAILRQYMQAVSPTDYTWSRPNRRQIDTGLYLPSLYAEGMGPIVVAIDTSGSVDDRYINRACAEIFEIAREVNPEQIHVIQCDTRVTDCQSFEADDAPDEITIKGRGGTAFQPVFDFVAERDLQPDVLIYMTDLYGPQPADPGYPVIWGVEDDHQAGNAPFGQALVIPNGG